MSVVVVAVVVGEVVAVVVVIVVVAVVGSSNSNGSTSVVVWCALQLVCRLWVTSTFKRDIPHCNKSAKPPIEGGIRVICPNYQITEG